MKVTEVLRRQFEERRKRTEAKQKPGSAALRDENIKIFLDKEKEKGNGKEKHRSREGADDSHAEG